MHTAIINVLLFVCLCVCVQAFLEFGEDSAAVNMVSYYATNPAQVRLKPCYVQFSNHKELKTDAWHSFQVCLLAHCQPVENCIWVILQSCVPLEWFPHYESNQRHIWR